MYHARMRARVAAFSRGPFLLLASLLMVFACAGPRPSPLTGPERMAPVSSEGEPPASGSQGSPHPSTSNAPSSLSSQEFSPDDNFPLSQESPLAGIEWTVSEPGPFRLEAFGPKGRWVALCLGRGPNPEMRLHARDSRAAAELGLFGAIPRKLDALLDWSQDGRFLLTLETGVLWLLDLELGIERDLSQYSPDLRADKDPGLRSASFSEDSLELALLATSGQVTIFNLKDPGAPSKTLEPSSAAHRLRYSGVFLLAEAGPAAAWSIPPASKPVKRCERPPHVYDAYAKASEPNAAFFKQVELWRRGDPKASFEPAPGFLMTLGDGWVRREDDGRLVLVSGRVQKQLTSSKCGARVRFADSTQKLLLVACEKYRPRPEPETKTKTKPKKPQYLFPLYLVGPGLVRELGAEDARASYDLEPGPSLPWSPELISLTASGAPLIVDLKARKPWLLKERERLMTSVGRSALIREGTTIKAVQLGPQDARQEEKILELSSPFARILIAGPHLSADRALLHPSRGVRPLDRAPIALTPEGDVLLGSRMRDEWLEGPLWITRPFETAN